MDELQPFFALANQASGRARQTLYVLVVATTLVGSSVWNYRPGSWGSEELRILTYAVDHLGQPLAANPDKRTAQLHIKANQVVALMHREWKSGDGDTLERLKTMRSHARDRLEQHSFQTKIPIIGVAIHPNDTGMIGGFSLTVILMILQFSLAREGANLEFALREAADKNVLRAAYELVSMSQVLSVPPRSPLYRRHGNVWNRLHKMLFWLPLLVQGTVVVIDICTLERGWAISALNTVIELIGGAFFLVCIAYFGWRCHKESQATDQHWKTYSALLGAEE